MFGGFAMVPVNNGARRWSHFFARPFLRLALAGALVASLGLAACGRKGPLDPPPGASLEGVPQANMPELMSTNRTAGSPHRGPARPPREQPVRSPDLHTQ